MRGWSRETRPITDAEGGGGVGASLSRRSLLRSGTAWGREPAEKAGVVHGEDVALRPPVRPRVHDAGGGGGGVLVSSGTYEPCGGRHPAQWPVRPPFASGVRCVSPVDGLYKAMQRQCVVRCVPEPHWYLLLLGVDDPYRGQGLGGRLIEPVLARARQGEGCLLPGDGEGGEPELLRPPRIPPGRGGP